MAVVYQLESGGWRGRSQDVTSRGRTLAACRVRMRRALAETRGCREDELALQESFDLPEGLGEVLESVREVRRQADQHRQRSVEVTQEVVTRLAHVEPSLGMRDIGQLVGVSYQRVQQLLSETNGSNGSNGRA
ncbi:MAG: hypothetical protein ABR540_04805 [Acidimicrobiales bacterium]